MESVKSSRFAGVAPLLALPREIRDPIYEDLMTHGSIHIGMGIASIPEFEDHTYTERFDEHIKDWSHDPRVRCRRRSTWEVPIVDVLPRTPWNYSWQQHLRLQMTYRGSPHHVSRTDFNLRIFLVCKQIYHEAREIFYARNTFSFLAGFRIPTALHFLQDRPAGSRIHIQSMRLALTEEYKVTVQDPENANLVRYGYSLTNFHLRFEYDCFDQLCSIIANTTNLQHLGLITDAYQTTWSRDSTPWVQSMQDFLDVEKNQTTKSTPWVESLTSIHGLKTVYFRSLNDLPMLKRHATITKTMRERMLRKDIVAGAQSLSIRDTDPVQMLTRLHGDYLFDGHYDVASCDFILECDVDSGEMTWRDARLEFEPFGTARIVPKEEYAKIDEPEQEHVFECYASGVICFTKLESE